MKAIILAAGKGTRLRPLTNTTPKPLIKIFGKTILEHNLEHIYTYVDEIIIVVKYLQEKIRKKLGDNYKGVKITYQEQGIKKGTAGAIMGLQTDSDVIIINGDSIFHKDDIQSLIEMKGYGVLVKGVEEPEKYGIFEVNNAGFAKKVIEKPKKFVGNLANLGVYKFSKEIFEISETLEMSERGEYELTDAINIFIKQHDFRTIEIQNTFLDISYSWDILDANSYFLEALQASVIHGEIEENVVIKGKIILEEGAILKSGTYIEGNVYIGKDSSIGPNIYLRGNTIIGDNCKLGNAVEVKNSTIGDNTNMAHLSYLGDSVLGNNINIGGGFSSANLRHDGKTIKVMVKGKLVDTGKTKLGTIIGDNTKTAINTSVMPGRIIENDTFTLPSEIVK